MARLTHCPVCTVSFTEHLEWRDPVTGEVLPARPGPDDPAGLREWLTRDPAPHCSGGHRLPHRFLDTDVLVMSIVGPTAAGKSNLVGQFAREVLDAALADRGLHLSLSRHDRDEATVYKQDVLTQTSSATPDKPRLALVFEVDLEHDGRHRPVVDLMVFDCGGEDVKLEDAKTLRDVTPFLPLSDIVVFALPPDGLPDLPDQVRYQDQTETTRAWFQLAAEWVRDGSTADGRDLARCTVVVALTKADRYLSLPEIDLDRNLLHARRLRGALARGLDETMAAEQASLFDFVQRAGGQWLLTQAAKINGRVFLTAVSGVAGDDSTGGRRADRLLGMGPNRALDPVLIAFMRRGIGQFRPTAAAR